jgi:hypothetical protein
MMNHTPADDELPRCEFCGHVFGDDCGCSCCCDVQLPGDYEFAYVQDPAYPEHKVYTGIPLGIAEILRPWESRKVIVISNDDWPFLDEDPADSHARRVPANAS